MVIVGDSDFLTDNYLNIAGNRELGLSIIRWLGRDDRFVDVRRAESPFEALRLSPVSWTHLWVILLVIYPVIFFMTGSLYLWIRSRTS